MKPLHRHQAHVSVITTGTAHRSTRTVALFAIAAAALVTRPVPAHAHGTFNMVISSTRAVGGALQLDYDFSSVSLVAFDATIGGVSLYTGTEPAFELLAANVPATPAYVLSNGTDVSVEITGIDVGKASVKIGDTLLSRIGDSVLLGNVPFDHVHPQLQLQLTLPEGQFGEGSISFKLTTATSAYTASGVYTLKLSNGPLAHFDYDPTAYAKSSVACQSLVGLQVNMFIATKLTYVRACLDKLQVYTALSDLTTPPSNLAKARAAAELACAATNSRGPDRTTMLGKIAALRAATFTAIKNRCGTPSPPTVPKTASGNLSDDAINELLGFASCRAEELAAGVYGNAKEVLAGFTARPAQGGQTLDTYFPCLYATASD